MTRTKGRSYVRRKGYLIVALQVSDDDFEFASRYAERGAYFDAVDCLNALLNTAILEARDTDDGSPPDEHEDLRVVQDDGGQASLAGSRTDDDDDIPF